MKRIKTYKQYIDEGLIKTVDIRTLIKHINKMNMDNGFLDIIGRSKADEVGHIVMIVSNQEKTPLFAKKLASLLNIHGYYVSNLYYFGHGFDENKPHPVKSNEEFVDAVNNLNDFVDEFQVDIEPRFEEAADVKNKQLYHITERNHLDKIMKIGLVPRSKSKLSYHPERIYLADKSAVAHIYGKYKDYVKDPVILKVDVKGLSLYPDINAGQGAYFTTTNIHPSKIKVLKEDPKKFVDDFFHKHPDKDEEIPVDLERLLNNLLHAIH